MRDGDQISASTYRSAALCRSAAARRAHSRSISAYNVSDRRRPARCPRAATCTSRQLCCARRAAARPPSSPGRARAADATAGTKSLSSSADRIGVVVPFDRSAGPAVQAQCVQPGPHSRHEVGDEDRATTVRNAFRPTAVDSCRPLLHRRSPTRRSRTARRSPRPLDRRPTVPSTRSISMATAATTAPCRTSAAPARRARASPERHRHQSGQPSEHPVRQPPMRIIAPGSPTTCESPGSAATASPPASPSRPTPAAASPR